ncbi:glycosylphosphatidylinositol anchored membrane protein boudin isoform X2 [Rhipicephalus microplus]|uniref:glycosylphosphatidylinositol anchored membrane protein boudin isoform X2 n=1 Tax=Rhipicephalus microplus TaxID=6941 RepID=UPI003F6A69CA
MKCRNVSCAKYIVTVSGAVALLDCRRRHRFEREFDLQTVGNSTEAAANIRVMGNSQGPRLNYGDLGCIEAVYCHQCDSNQHLHCSELWDHNNSPEPTSCDNLYEANYCIKATGRIGTFRFCSSRDRGHYCDYVKRPGDDREYRACIYTCSGNGCNASSILRPWAGGVLVLLVVVLAWMVAFF